MKAKNIQTLFLAVVLIAIIILARLVPHSPNFIPVAAIALFAGFMLKNKYWALSIPLLGMLISDFLFVGSYEAGSMLFVYIGLCLPVFMSFILKWNPRLSFLPATLQKGGAHCLKWTAAALSASIVFFVVSNLGVWLFSGMYTLDLAGLINCFTLAIPFFQYTVLGDLAYVFIFFGAYELAIASARFNWRMKEEVSVKTV